MVRSRTGSSSLRAIPARRQIVEVAPAVTALNEVADLLKDLEYSFYAHSRLFLFAHGHVTSVHRHLNDLQRRFSKRRLEVGPYEGRVVSAVAAGDSAVVETSRNLYFISGGRTQALDTGPVISLRTYPRAVRYPQIATATTARGVWFALVDS